MRWKSRSSRMVKVMVTGHTPKGDRCRLVGIELEAHAKAWMQSVRSG
jgi:hypothetical protein